MIVRHARRLPIATLMALEVTCGLLSGCRRSAPGLDRAAPTPVESKPSLKAVSTTRTYRLVGVVRDVKPGASQVIIRHEAIPDIMEAMTMPFTIKDRTLLDDLRPGDEVEGMLRIEWEDEQIKDYELTELTVTRPALPPALSLSLSGDESVVRPKPRILEVGEPVPDFTMTTQDGQTLSLSNLRGKVVVLTFIYTRCPLPDFCPLMDRKFAELADKLRASPRRSEGVRLLSISFDPEHDTPEVLRKHAANQGVRPPLWTFAVASHAELSKVAGPLGLVYGPGRDEIIHNLSTAVIDSQGRLARLEAETMSRKSWTPSDLLKTIRSLTSPPSRKGG
jgi:protein SCO1